MASNAMAIPRCESGDPFSANKSSVASRSSLFRWLLSGDTVRDSASHSATSGGAIDSSASDRARCDALVELFRAIGGRNSIAELTSVLAAAAAQLIKFDFIGISRCDDATRTVEWHVAISNAKVESGKADATAGETMTGWVYHHQRPLVIPALDRHTRLQSRILQLVQDGIQSVCAVPLSCMQHKLGALFLGSVLKDAYGEEEVRLISLVATQVCSAIEKHLAHGQISMLKDRLARRQEELYIEEDVTKEGIGEGHGFEEIVGRSATLRNVLQQIETVAPTDCTVLICGETGTGKELIARAIHDRSSRHGASFVKLNCAAIPTGLLESELFGHEKGAFTGAISQRIGRFELADHGTMFLDEIGEIPLELQPKLLRVLQEREFERLGNSRTLHTDTRLIAATNRDLEQMVEENRFRSDLFYRLNVFPIRIPALRERPEDIPVLVQHFTKQFAKRMNKQIDSIASETMKALCQYHWPGNIRELQNVIERAVLMTQGSELHVPLAELKRRTVAADADTSSGTLEEADRAHILRTLELTDWVIAGPKGAAARLGMHRSTLQFRMRKLGISIVRAAKQ